MLSGTITATKIQENIFMYVCRIKTPGMQVMKVSYRSRMEALTEALKYLGMPL